MRQFVLKSAFCVKHGARQVRMFQKIAGPTLPLYASTAPPHNPFYRCLVLDSPPTSYHEAGSTTPIVDHSSTYTLDSSSGPGDGFSDDPTRPSWEKDVVPTAGGVHIASMDQAGDAEAGWGGGGDAGERPELRWKHWTMFVFGHLISAAVIVSVIAQLSNVCFDKYVGATVDGDTGASIWDEQEEVEEEYPQNSEALTKKYVFVVLMWGLAIEFCFAVSLSLVYGTPVDLKSLHKIPLETLSLSGEHLYVFVSAPQLWSAIYLIGGGLSQSLALNSACERQGGPRIELYLTISGIFMTVVGFMFIGVLFVGVCIQLSRWGKRSEGGCCDATKTVISQHILSKSPFLDVFWRVQGIVWMYRVGGFGLVVSVFLGLCSAAGVVLTAVGSRSPDVVRRSQEDRNTITYSWGANSGHLTSRRLIINS